MTLEERLARLAAAQAELEAAVRRLNGLVKRG